MMFQLEDQFEFLQEKEGFNAKFYGAKGNGVDDDTDALKKALFSMTYEEKANKTLFIPAGVYLISETITIPEDVVVVGEGNTTIKYNANNISIVLERNTRIENVILDAKDVTVIDALTITKSNVKINNVEFKNFSGINSKLIYLYGTKGTMIENCIFENIDCDMCINIKNSKKTFIKNNRFELNTFAKNHNGAVAMKADLSKQETFDEIKRIAGDREIDVVIAGPPCQGFSLTGPRNFDDERNKLYLAVIEIVKQ